MLHRWCNETYDLNVAFSVMNTNRITYLANYVTISYTRLSCMIIKVFSKFVYYLHGQFMEGNMLYGLSHLNRNF